MNGTESLTGRTEMVEKDIFCRSNEDCHREQKKKSQRPVNVCQTRGCLHHRQNPPTAMAPSSTTSVQSGPYPIISFATQELKGLTLMRMSSVLFGNGYVSNQKTFFWKANHMLSNYWHQYNVKQGNYFHK